MSIVEIQMGSKIQMLPPVKVHQVHPDFDSIALFQ